MADRTNKALKTKIPSSNSTDPLITDHYIVFTQITFVQIPKLPLLRNRTQQRRTSVSSTTPPPSRRTTGGDHSPAILDLLAGNYHLRHQIAATAAFLTPTLHKRGAGFDGQCGHLLRLQWMLEPAEWQSEVELARLELLVLINGLNDVVEVHLVRVADKGGGVLLKHVGNLYWVRVFL
ncbi:unnamed protein product [Prunus brigantina]